MKASAFLHCAFRSPEPLRIGKFYASLFDCGFFVHPVLAGLGVVMVKIANPEAVYRGLIEFWPLDILWDGPTTSLRRGRGGEPGSQNHLAFRVDQSKEEILNELSRRGIAARFEPRGLGMEIVCFDDPDGNFVEIFPGVDHVSLPPEAFCPVENIDAAMALFASQIEDHACHDARGKTYYPLMPVSPAPPARP